MKVTTSSATAVRISFAIGPPSSRRAPASGIDSGARFGAGSASRGSPPTASWVAAARLSTSEMRPTTRVIISSSKSGSPIDGRLISTLARRATSRRLGEQCRDIEVAGGVDVAPAGQCLGDRDEFEAGLDAGHRDFRGVARGDLQGRRAGRALRVRLARQLHRGRELAEGGGVLVGEVEESIGEGEPRRVRPGVQVRVLRRTSGGPIDSDATMATSEAPRLAATAEALPPPGTGAAEPRASTNPPTVRSRKRVGVVGSTHRLYGCGSVPVVPGARIGMGRARYRRARP